MKLKVTTFIFIFTNLITFGQNSIKESWSFGAGISNFIINGDLKSKESIFNLGAYGYVDKMISPSIGFELRFGYNTMSGKGNDGSFYLNNSIPIDKTYFKGTTLSLETNVIYNLSNIIENMHHNNERKFNYSFLLGVGVQTYDSKLYHVNTNKLLVDYGNSPSKNSSTGSFYYTFGFNVKYKLKKNLEIEFRQNFNINEEDHLDALISNKSNLDYFYKSNIGIVYTLNDKENKNFAWYDNADFIIVDKDTNITEKSIEEDDDDNDGVINKYDIEANTPIGAIVYGNGVAIDSDEDGIINLYDKCPLKYAKTKTGCKEDIDTDNDGIIDKLDECPTLYGKTKNGCPKEQNIINVKVEPVKEQSDTERYKQIIIAEVNAKNTKHGNKKLDNSVNISDIDTSPIFPGCESKNTKFDITNCIISNISKYVDINYNLNVAKSISGKVRVLFIVDEKGDTNVIDILGEYSTDAKDELKRVLESLPKIKPGTLKGINVPVKYSLLFILK